MVGREEQTYFTAPAQALREVRPAGMTDHPKERGKVKGGTVRCMS